jgi:hypothetical protein
MGSWRRECFDPKDYVFGIYGLFRRFYISHLPAVDYSRLVEDIYADVVKMTVTSEKSLKIIWDQFSGIQVQPSLPSWVPDWSHHQPGRLSLRTIGGAFEVAPIPETVFFEFPEASQISLKCKIADVITEVSNTSPGDAWDIDGIPPSERVGRVKMNIGAFLEWVRMLLASDPYPGGEPMLEAFFKTLTFGADTDCKASACRAVWGKGADTRPFLEAFIMWFIILSAEGVYSNQHILNPLRDYLAQGIGGIDKLMSAFALSLEDCWKIPEMRIALAFWYPSTIVLGDSGIVLGDSGLRGTKSDDTKFIELLTLLDRTTHGRKFLITERGYMGLAISEVKTGDKVFLISGIPLPMICRPTGDQYQFVSPAYVHGIMHGELWDQVLREESLFTFI